MIPVPHSPGEPRPDRRPSEYARYATAFLLLFAFAALAALVSGSPVVWVVAALSGAAGVGYRFADGIARARQADASLPGPPPTPRIPRQRQVDDVSPDRDRQP